MSEVCKGTRCRISSKFNRVIHLTSLASPTAEAKSRSQSRLCFLVVAVDDCGQSLPQSLPVQRPRATVIVLPIAVLPPCWIHFYRFQLPCPTTRWHLEHRRQLCQVKAIERRLLTPREVQNIVDFVLVTLSAVQSPGKSIATIE